MTIKRHAEVPAGRCVLQSTVLVDVPLLSNDRGLFARWSGLLVWPRWCCMAQRSYAQKGTSVLHRSHRGNCRAMRAAVRQHCKNKGKSQGFKAIPDSILIRLLGVRL